LEGKIIRAGCSNVNQGLGEESAEILAPPQDAVMRDRNIRRRFCLRDWTHVEG